MHDEDFAALIAGLESHGVSQQEIARRTGVSRATVWRLANNVCQNHFAGTVNKIRALSDTVTRQAALKRA